MQTRTASSAIVGMTFAPLFFSVQAQAYQAPTQVVQVAATKACGADRRARITHGAVLSLAYDVRLILRNMSASCEALNQQIVAMAEQIEHGEDVALSHSMGSMASNNRESLKDAMDSAVENFDIILSGVSPSSVPVINGLKNDTLAGMQEVINVMSKISEIDNKLKDRKKTIVVFDQDRMKMALNEERIIVDKKLTRAEIRQLILQHAS